MKLPGDQRLRMNLLGNLLLLSGTFVSLSYGTWMALEAYLGHLADQDAVSLAAAIGLGALMCLFGGLLRH